MRRPAAWTLQGNAVHAALEAYEKSWRQLSEVELIEIFEDEWSRLLGEAIAAHPDLDTWLQPGRKKVENDLDDRHAESIEQIRRYLSYVQTDPLKPWVLPDTGEPASEVEFFADFDGIPVYGFIDLILMDPRTGALHIRDIKTGSKRPAGAIQLGIYRHAVRLTLGIDPLWGDYWMGKDGAPLPPVDLTRYNYAWVARELRQMDESERAGRYLANPGDHCRVCDVAHHCLVMS
ncbi:PD-(D/E)XK nuclease superfamily protein [Sinosporangium album]|uniref:PD-(D/E)XK nuclease superfamily protein n=2 Tax=Sinosporangium album TaxID=504805 RepID=A0A1G8A9N7_9ACTN|nr:PD-(D/E)XK nuclease superfamily protein [Sinosporangium album]